MNIIAKTFFLVFFTTNVIAQGEILTKGVVDVDQFLDDTYFIIHTGEDHKISILDPNFEIVGSYIRHGDGPGEAKSVYALFVDNQTRMIYILKHPGILMVFNETFDLLNEINLGRNINSGRMVLINQTVFLRLITFTFLIPMIPEL